MLPFRVPSGTTKKPSYINYSLLCDFLLIHYITILVGGMIKIYSRIASDISFITGP